MESYEQKIKEEAAIKAMNKEKNSNCKNADFSLNKDLQIVVTGCVNPRRNGSAYCQECSDNHAN